MSFTLREWIEVYEADRIALIGDDWQNAFLDNELMTLRWFEQADEECSSWQERNP